jgi:hypothetical protein
MSPPTCHVPARSWAWSARRSWRGRRGRCRLLLIFSMFMFPTARSDAGLGAHSRRSGTLAGLPVRCYTLICWNGLRAFTAAETIPSA